MRFVFYKCHSNEVVNNCYEAKQFFKGCDFHKNVYPCKPAKLYKKWCSLRVKKVVGGHEMAAMIWMIIMALCVCINKMYYHQHNCNI